MEHWTASLLRLIRQQQEDSPFYGFEQDVLRLGNYIAERDAALATAEALLAELTDVLDYAGHARNCARVYFDSSCTCDCGWDAMRKRHHEARKCLTTT